MVSGKEDAGGNFALGYNAAGRKILDESIDTIRVMLESCEASGLMIYHSLGGGTGAGFGSLLLQNLSDQFDKLPKLGCTIYPYSKLSTNFVEPYNTVLATHKMIYDTDCSIVLDN